MPLGVVILADFGKRCYREVNDLSARKPQLFRLLHDCRECLRGNHRVERHALVFCRYSGAAGSRSSAAVLEFFCHIRMFLTAAASGRRLFFTS